VELHEIHNKVEFIIDFINIISNLHDSIPGIEKTQDINIPKKIKKLSRLLHIPPNLENELHRFNRWRNELVAHREDFSREERNSLLKNTENRLSNTYLGLLAYLLKYLIQYIANNNKWSVPITHLKRFIFKMYFNKSAFTEQEVNKIQDVLR
jgi:hypothetical protein